MVIGFSTFATSLHAQTASTVKADKPSCQKPCTKSAQASATNYSFFSVLTAAASEEKASTPSTKVAKEKAACQKVCTKTAATKANCNPQDCLPPNCKIVSCKPKSTAMAVNQKPGDKN